MRTERLAAGTGSARALAVLAATLCLVVSANTAVQAENWAQWRGPHFTGATEAEGLPSEWGPEKNVIWVADLPGTGYATPVIWGDRIFLNAADRETNELLALCLDAETGEELWRREHGENQRMGRNDMTAASAVTDGERAIFFFGHGRLVAYDFEGEELWRRELEEDFGRLTWLFGYGASPTLHQGKLYMQMMRRAQTPWRGQPPLDEPVDSYLLAIDPETGEDLWQVVRPTEAVHESPESYMTPLPLGEDEDSQIFLAGGDALTGHRADTGEELWRYNFNEEQRRRNWRLVPTPVTDGERIFISLPRGTSMVAIKPDGGVGPLDERAVWTIEDGAPDVCSPLLYRGRLYFMGGRRHRLITCVNPESGEQYWEGDLGSGAVVRSSPTAADGRIYVMDEDGRVSIVGTGDEFELIDTVEMGGGEPARSSIPIVGNRMYIRTASQLFCIGMEP